MSTLTTDQPFDIAAARALATTAQARAESATPGPWELAPYTLDIIRIIRDKAGRKRRTESIVESVPYEGGGFSEAVDAEFCVAARSDVPALAAALLAACAEMEQARAILAQLPRVDVELAIDAVANGLDPIPWRDCYQVPR